MFRKTLIHNSFFFPRTSLQFSKIIQGSLIKKNLPSNSHCEREENVLFFFALNYARGRREACYLNRTSSVQVMTSNV